LGLVTELDPQGGSAQFGPIAALAVGDERVLEFTGVQHQPHMQLLLDYRDLAGRTYSTSITLDLQQRRAYDVRLFEGASTHHGDSVYPQPGLRDVTAKGPRPLRQRIRDARKALTRG
jgi:hypothetical protein